MAIGIKRHLLSCFWGEFRLLLICRFFQKMPEKKQNGWIKLYRQMQDSELYFSEKFTKTQAWIDLLLLANHEDRMFFLRGNEIQVKRGFIGFSEEHLAKRWKWSRMKVRRFRDWLETRQQIKQHRSKILSQIEIVNYNEFQQNETSDETTEKHQTRQQKNTNKNDKNDKNYKNINNTFFVKNENLDLLEKKDSKIKKSIQQKIYSSKSNEMILSEKLFNNIKLLNPNYKKPDFQKWAKNIDLMSRVDKRTFEEIDEIINWVAGSVFWRKNILSTSKLRDQYDKLYIISLDTRIGGEMVTDTTKQTINMRFKDFFNRIGREPTEKEKQNILNKIKNKSILKTNF